MSASESNGSTGKHGDHGSPESTKSAGHRPTGEPSPTPSVTSEPPVLTHVTGHAGHIVLNRPKAINALSAPMVDLVRDALEEFAADDAVRTVVLTGAGERGLCAGGDIVALYEDAKEHGPKAARYWADEYRVDLTIATYPKPFVAIMDGIVLGGGIGLSAHASIRVVTERSKVGMPETGIGFIPDVGGTWLLSHTPGQVGTHLGLTAGNAGPGDAVALGLADHVVDSADLPALLERLGQVDAFAAVAEFSRLAPESPLSAARSWIDETYVGDDVVAILDRLEASDVPEANAAAATIRKKSPTSVRVTLRALREAATMRSLAHAIDQEYRLALRAHAGHDFVEGVRAQVVEKDRNPSWSPARVEDVSDADVEAFFAPLGEAELGLADLVEATEHRARQEKS